MRRALKVVIRSGSLRELLVQLEAHAIDVVLSNLPVKREAHTGWQSHLLGEEPVSLVGRPGKGQRPFRFPDDLRGRPVILPSLASDMRVAFDLVMERAGIQPLIAAEVEDMAMLRLVARGSDAPTLVPPVVVRDELREGVLVERHQLSQIRKGFYAITPSWRFPNELVRQLIERKGRR